MAASSHQSLDIATGLGAFGRQSLAKTELLKAQPVPCLSSTAKQAHRVTTTGVPTLTR
jgi:hypothetical protein